MASRIAGALAGLVAGIILLQFGFWQAVFLVACTGIGWWIAPMFLGETAFREWLDRNFRHRRGRQ